MELGLFRRKSEEEKKEAYYMASQWQLMARRLKRHKLARVSMVFLFILYAAALFGDFIAPQGLTSYDSKSINVPPTKVHIFHEGKLEAPFVYGLKMERDPNTMQRIYVEDRDVKFALKFLVKAEEYKLFGIFKTNLHLFGVDEPGKVFIFGTDAMGRDLFSRILLGSQISLTIPFAGTAISFILGVMLGGLSGYFGGIVDMIIQRIIEVIVSFPTIPLWMALAAAIPPKIPVVKMYFYITIIISFISWTSLARIVRGKFISLRQEDFVMAAKIAGVSNGKIIIKHLVPGFMSYLIVNLTLGFPGMILGETSMSFLGLGIRSPATSWGVLLQEAQQIQNVALYPWKLIPLIFVIITVLSFNFLGDGMRDAADPYK